MDDPKTYRPTWGFIREVLGTFCKEFFFKTMRISYVSFVQYFFHKYDKGVIAIDLLTIYWYVLIGSLVVAILFLFVGDILSNVFDSFFHPLLLFGALAVISGTGILLTTYTGLSAGIVLGIGFALGVVTYVLIYNFLIIPISHAESSNAYSVQEYRGRIAEVITTIPATGYGEILISSPAGSRSETAQSFDHINIVRGTRVFVVEVDKESMLHVSPMEDDFE